MQQSQQLNSCYSTPAGLKQKEKSQDQRWFSPPANVSHLWRPLACHCHADGFHCCVLGSAFLNEEPWCFPESDRNRKCDRRSRCAHRNNLIPSPGCARPSQFSIHCCRFETLSMVKNNTQGHMSDPQKDL